MTARCNRPGNRWGFSPWCFRCPHCGRDDRIDVAATVWARVAPDGSTIGPFETVTHEWGLRSIARCNECKFQSRLVAFTPSDRGAP